MDERLSILGTLWDGVEVYVDSSACVSAFVGKAWQVADLMVDWPDFTAYGSPEQFEGMYVLVRPGCTPAMIDDEYRPTALHPSDGPWIKMDREEIVAGHKPPAP